MIGEPDKTSKQSSLCPQCGVVGHDEATQCPKCGEFFPAMSDRLGQPLGALRWLVLGLAGLIAVVAVLSVLLGLLFEFVS